MHRLLHNLILGFIAAIGATNCTTQTQEFGANNFKVDPEQAEPDLITVSYYACYSFAAKQLDVTAYLEELIRTAARQNQAVTPALIESALKYPFAIQEERSEPNTLDKDSLLAFERHVGQVWKRDEQSIRGLLNKCFLGDGGVQVAFPTFRFVIPPSGDLESGTLEI